MNTLRLVSLLNFVERAPFVLGAWVSYYYMSSSLRVLPPFKRVMMHLHIQNRAAASTVVAVGVHKAAVAKTLHDIIERAVVLCGGGVRSGRRDGPRHDLMLFVLALPAQCVSRKASSNLVLLFYYSYM